MNVEAGVVIHRFGVNAFPTLKYFPAGDKQVSVSLQGYQILFRHWGLNSHSWLAVHRGWPTRRVGILGPSLTTLTQRQG